jgi:fructokinase
LFDLLPDGPVLGGAPLNVAVQAHQASAPLGGRGVVVSRVGQDELGEQIIADLRGRGMTVEHVQSDPDHETGKVYVNLSAGGGSPSYEIVDNVAWDWLQFDPDLESLAARCEAVCFGSLAQRQTTTRDTIHRFLGVARRAVRLFDVNLRQQYFSESVLRRSCELASVVKLNEHELPIVLDALGIDANAKGEAGLDRGAAALLKKTNVQMVALTRGARGTVLYTADQKATGEPASYPPAANADSVGAGDACSAGLLVGLVQRWPLQRTVDLANHLGAFVASQPGATPALPDEVLAMVK